MIVKSFEVNKKLIQNKKFFLMYGENQGLKNETIQKEFKKNYPDSVYNYDENEILSNEENFFENISSKSFFEKEKLIIINRVTDKIKNLIEEIVEKKIADLVIILNANSLEKKSKIRSYFEKTKDIICIPFYNDNNQTLSIIVGQFFREKKIPISQKLINLLVQRSRGDRQNLNNELKKIENFVLNKSKIEINDILKLTNLAENYSVSELVDNCLAKNKRTTINILNENNYSLDDCILVIRTFLLKSKRILKLKKEFKINNNMETTLSSSKPPIFWKDKEIVKQHIGKYKDPDFIDIKTIEEDYEGVAIAMKHFQRYTMGIIGNTLTPFQQDVFDLLSEETVQFKKLGLLAYVPELVKREVAESKFKKMLRMEYRNSKDIGAPKDMVEGVIKILSKFWSEHWESFNYVADLNGNLVSFMNKIDHDVGDRKRLKGKVKAHGKNRNFDVNETRLNYCKVYKI